jgi:lysozyme
MKTSGKGIALITHYEGLRLDKYKCPGGVWTIGYGHTEAAEKLNKITKEKAVELLRFDLSKFEKQVEKALPNIEQHQFDAVVSFCFNVGFGAFIKSTLFKRIKNVEGRSAIDIEFRKWNKVGGQVLDGLTKRRTAESYLFLTGNLKLF